MCNKHYYYCTAVHCELLPIELLVHLLDYFLKSSINSIHIGSKMIHCAVDMLEGGVSLCRPKHVVTYHVSRKARGMERRRRVVDFFNRLWILADKICECTTRGQMSGNQTF